MLLYYIILYYRISDMYTYAFEDATKAVQNKSPQGDFHHAFLRSDGLQDSGLGKNKISRGKDMDFWTLPETKTRWWHWGVPLDSHDII